MAIPAAMSMAWSWVVSVIGVQELALNQMKGSNPGFARHHFWPQGLGPT